MRISNLLCIFIVLVPLCGFAAHRALGQATQETKPDLIQKPGLARSLDVSGLTESSSALDRPVSVWHDHKPLVLATLALCLAEATLIIVLIVQMGRKRAAEESLKEAEEKYRNIFNGALEGIFETSLEGRILTANPALLKMFGYDSPDEVMATVRDTGRQVWADPHEREEYTRLLEREDVVRGYECQFLRKDGTKFWASLNTRRVAGPDGKTLFYTGFMEDISERKGAEEAVKESEAKYRSLYKSMTDGFAVVGMDGMVKEYNESFREMTGYRPEELPRLTYRNLTPDKWHDFEQKIIEEQVLVRGYSDVYEKEYRKQDGTIFPVELRTFLLKDEHGKNSGMWAIVRDITERRRAEDALQESNERFRQVAENVGDVIWEVDANGLYRYTSPSVERILGYRPDELVGKMHFYELFAPEVREELKAAALKVFAAKQSFRAFPNQNVSRDGRIVYLETSGVPILDAAGDLVGYRGADTDITERRRVEEERQRLAAAVEHTGEAVFIMDSRYIVHYVNPAFVHLTGYAWDEIVDRDISLLRSGTEANPLYEDLRRKLESGGSWTGVYPIRHKDGIVSPTRISASSIRDASGKITHYVVVCQDITEQRKLEADLRQAQKMEALGTLTGGIAHDFNNILAAMMGFTELVKENVLKGSHDEHRLQRVLDAGLRGRELIKQMLTFSRKTEQDKKPLQMSSLIKETAKFLRASIAATISIRVKIESESGLILGDPIQMQQVLMNLCGNAAHAMREKGGVLDIELSDFSVPESGDRPHGLKAGPYVELVVHDTGIGMPPDIIDRIFDPFFTTKKPDEGTGLGLSVVHGIIQQHGGSITVESVPGEGSTFTIYLPRIRQEAKGETSKEEAIPTGHERVLFVDDEEALIETGQQLLEGLGYKVTAEKSSLEALNLFSADSGSFDLVVTDHTMPEMTGLELAKACMAIRPDIPVILATGFSHLVNVKAVSEAGIRALIMKPITKGELARTVRNALDHKQ